MNRRQVLAAAGSASVLPVGGCLGGLGRRPNDAEPDEDPPTGSVPHDLEPTAPPDLPAGPEAPPDRPDEIAVETVSAYVEAFEYAYAYNLLHCRDAGGLDVYATAGLERETDHGVYAFAAASGSVRCGAGEEPDHRDYGPQPSEYAVGEEYVVRVGEDDVEIRDGPDAAGEGTGLIFTNFDHRAHELEVTVDREGEAVYEDAIDLAARSRVRVPDVAAVRGDHDVAVETDEGATASGTWSVDPGRNYDRMGGILATGEATVEYLDPYADL